MTTFTLNIDTDNAAFMDEPDGRGRVELADILRRLAERIESTYAVSGPIRDTNGTTVGRYDWADEVPAPAATSTAAMRPQSVPTGDDEPLHLLLPDGRTLGLWAHHCEDCTSLDVWTERPGAAPASYHFGGVMADRTGAPDRQPFGLFTLTGGRGFEMAGGSDATAATMKRNAQSTAILVWNDKEL